jgi:hypothetical protein
VGRIDLIGNRALYSCRKTLVTALVTDAFTTRTPVCGVASNPQYDTVSWRSCAAPTGQPACQLAPSCAVLTAVTTALNGILVLGGAGGAERADGVVARTGDTEVVAACGVGGADVSVVVGSTSGVLRVTGAAAVGVSASCADRALEPQATNARLRKPVTAIPTTCFPGTDGYGSPVLPSTR